MESNHPHCPDCTCDLLRKLEESTDPFAFIEENIPINIVLDNLHEASKNTMECTCCLFGNILWNMQCDRYHSPRLKRTFTDIKICLWAIRTHPLKTYFGLLPLSLLIKDFIKKVFKKRK